jgi:hypothetical protein
MSEQAREIRFEHFRGLPNYSCELKGKSIVILGGNGKGKSGIVDGIEFLFAGKIGRFHGEGTGGIDAGEAIQHADKNGEPAVELYFTPTNDRVRRALSSSELEVPAKPTIEVYITSHPPVESFILRRGQILNFISDQDANRYRKYIQLLGLTDVDNVQRAFVEAGQLAETQLAIARQSLSLELAVFRESGWAPTTLDSILARCSQVISEFGSPELTHWDQLDSVIESLESKRSPETAGQVDALNRAMLSFERPLPSGVAGLVAEAAELQSVLTSLREASEEAAAAGIIREAISFFASREARVCPLCERSLDEGYGDVLERLNKRNEALTQLRQNEERISHVLDLLITKVHQTGDLLANDLKSESLLAPEDVKSLRDARASSLRWWRLLKRIQRDHSPNQIQLSINLESLQSLRERLLAGLTARRTSLIPADTTQLENAIAFLKKAKNSEPRIRSGETEFTKSTRTSAEAKDARDVFSTARERSIQLVFDQIAGKVLDYYKKLHDINADETSECTQLVLTATPRAAAGGLRLVVEFLGLVGSSDPRAFLSEGHLDSLGLCLYLATVRLFNPPGTLLVLDDVLTSIDKEHRHRVAELLFEEFADFQIVLTTHDEHWFGILQSMAQARGDLGKWIFKRIARWTLHGGPESAAFESTWSFIEANLTEEAYRELGGPLRLVLEDFLKRVAAKISLKVNYKFDGKYTSGDFTISGIQHEIRRELIAKSPGEEEIIKREIGRVFGQGDLINFLSHDNPGRLEVTLEQTIDFVSGLKAVTKRCQDNQLMKGVSA